MAEVKVEWQIRAMGRDAGDVETVERTPLVDALISQGRVKVLEEVKVESFPTDLPGAASVEDAKEEVTEVELSEAEEAPKPRAPRRNAE